MKKIIAFILFFSIGFIGCSAQMPTTWDEDTNAKYYSAANVAGRYRAALVVRHEGRYTNAEELERKFDSAFFRLFKRYSPEILERRRQGDDTTILAQSYYGRYRVQALLIIYPDKTYELKVRSAAKKHNNRWALKIKELLDR
ncbi:MAG: hypothetical protein LBC07_05720 [Elusimicrobiota bacterium]|jgi:hypothetical protein|nr:hypothetical protein [Elusimicrobiota bacterium]